MGKMHSKFLSAQLFTVPTGGETEQESVIELIGHTSVRKRDL